MGRARNSAAAAVARDQFDAVFGARRGSDRDHTVAVPATLLASIASDPHFDEEPDVYGPMAAFIDHARLELPAGSPELLSVIDQCIAAPWEVEWRESREAAASSDTLWGAAGPPMDARLAAARAAFVHQLATEGPPSGDGMAYTRFNDAVSGYQAAAEAQLQVGAMLANQRAYLTQRMAGRSLPYHRYVRNLSVSADQPFDEEELRGLVMLGSGCNRTCFQPVTLGDEPGRQLELALLRKSNNSFWDAGMTPPPSDPNVTPAQEALDALRAYCQDVFARIDAHTAA